MCVVFAEAILSAAAQIQRAPPAASTFALGVSFNFGFLLMFFFSNFFLGYYPAKGFPDDAYAKSEKTQHENLWPRKHCSRGNRSRCKQQRLKTRVPADFPPWLAVLFFTNKHPSTMSGAQRKPKASRKKKGECNSA